MLVWAGGEKLGSALKHLAAFGTLGSGGGGVVWVIVGKAWDGIGMATRRLGLV